MFMVVRGGGGVRVRHSEGPSCPKSRQSNHNLNPNPNPDPNPNPSMRVLVGFMGRQPLGMAAVLNGGPTPVVSLVMVVLVEVFSIVW